VNRQIVKREGSKLQIFCSRFYVKGIYTLRRGGSKED